MKETIYLSCCGLRAMRQPWECQENIGVTWKNKPSNLMWRTRYVNRKVAHQIFMGSSFFEFRDIVHQIYTCTTWKCTFNVSKERENIPQKFLTFHFFMKAAKLNIRTTKGCSISFFPLKKEIVDNLILNFSL